MSDCQYTDRMSSYLDSELPPDESTAIESHLRECPACAEQLDHLRRIRSFLHAGRMPETPPEALRRAHLQCGALPTRSVMRLAVRLTLAAAAVLLACLGWLWRGDARSLPQADSEPTWASAAVAYPAERDAEASVESRLARWFADEASLETGHD